MGDSRSRGQNTLHPQRRRWEAALRRRGRGWREPDWTRMGSICQWPFCWLKRGVLSWPRAGRGARARKRGSGVKVSAVDERERGRDEPAQAIIAFNAPAAPPFRQARPPQSGNSQYPPRVSPNSLPRSLALSIISHTPSTPSLDLPHPTNMAADCFHTGNRATHARWPRTCLVPAPDPRSRNASFNFPPAGSSGSPLQNQHPRQTVGIIESALRPSRLH